jgi:hypothetical protein
MKFIQLGGALVIIQSLAGCASIVSGTNQPVSVETRAENGMNVVGANCKLTNNKGTWFATTPASVTVNRSYEALQVRCDHKAHTPGELTVNSSTKGMAFGNILFGGPLGVGVDMATGAAYDYPNLISVTMGRASTIGTAPPAPPSQEEKK